ncbi:hypothetical protein [Gluconobacter oxydans]
MIWKWFCLRMAALWRLISRLHAGRAERALARAQFWRERAGV